MKWSYEGLGTSEVFFHTELVLGRYVRLKVYFNIEDPYVILGDFYSEQDAKAFAELWTLSHTFIQFCRMKDLLHEYQKALRQLDQAQQIRLEPDVELWELLTSVLGRRVRYLEHLVLEMQSKVDYDLAKFPYKVHFRQ